MYWWYIPRKCIDITTISTTIYTLLITEGDVTGGWGVDTEDTEDTEDMEDMEDTEDTDITDMDTDIDITDIGKQKNCAFFSIAY